MTVLDEITGRSGRPWPPPDHADRLAEQDDYGRLYRNRRSEILQRWSADLLSWVHAEDELVTYPSGKIATRTLAAFLFGEDPVITHSDDDVREAIAAAAVETNLSAKLLEGGITQGYEGEVYLRPAWDVEISPDYALPTVVPGSRVIPRFKFGVLVDAAIVVEYREEHGQTVWRHIEQHTRGAISNRLFRGTPDRLGSGQPLDAIPETADLDDEIATGVDKLLLVHVPLMRDASSPHGVSLFDGLVGLMLAIHRLYSTEQHDAELARKRVAMPESYVARDAAGRPSWDRQTDLFVLSESAEGSVGGSDGAGVVPIEFSDDLIQRDRIRGRLEDFLIACGLSPQTLIADEAGGAVSGTARKLAQAITLRTAAAAARYWQDAISRYLELHFDVQRIHLDPTTPPFDGERPTVSLSDGLIDDPAELARILGDLDAAEAISTIEKVRTLHPEWNEDRVLEEVELILERTPNAPPPPQVGTFGPPDDEDAGDAPPVEDDPLLDDDE